MDSVAGLSRALVLLTSLSLPHSLWMALHPGSRRKQKPSKRPPTTSTPRNISSTSSSCSTFLGHSPVIHQSSQRALGPISSQLPPLLPTGSFPSAFKSSPNLKIIIIIIKIKNKLSLDFTCPPNYLLILVPPVTLKVCTCSHVHFLTPPG